MRVTTFTFRLLACVAASGLAAGPLAAQVQGVALEPATPSVPVPDTDVRQATAKVNGAVITETDVAHRMALLLATSENTLSDEDKARLRAQVLRNLVDETLQVQAAAAQEMAVTPEEVAQAYRRLAAQNFGQDPEAMDAYLISIGSSPASLKRQIQGELAWSNLQRRNIAPFVNVSEEEVTEVIERLEASRGTEEFRIGEIYLSATPETDGAVRENARRIIEQLREGGNFLAYARQFSESSTAVVGGDLGYVRLETLPTAMGEAATSLQPGQVVGPIAIPGGYVVMTLIDRKRVLTADPRDATLSLKQIAIGLPPGVSEADASARVAEFAETVQSIQGCANAEARASTIGAEVVANEIVARQLPEQLQGTLLQMQIGEVTPPFGSIEDGVRVLMLCGRDDPSTDSGPNFDELMRRMEDERIAKRAQRYLRDLRNDAYIEYN